MYCVYDTAEKRIITEKPIPNWMAAAKICNDRNIEINKWRFEPRRVNLDNLLEN